MFKILKAEQLSANVYMKVVHAPRVAKSCEPGQFIIVKVDETAERIPLTICDYDREAGTITIVFQPIGVSTHKMVDLKEGDFFEDFVGPLGKPSELVTEDLDEVKKKKVVFIAGGVGTAPVYPQAKWLHDHGIECDIIVGARTKELLILEDEMSKVGNLHLCTDDGSYGRKGLVTELLKERLESDSVREVVAVGPVPMMQAVTQTTRPFGVATTVSLNSLMVDGIGMCGACRVTVGGETKFTCVDGPEFDGHKVDFDELRRRLGAFRTQEKNSLEHHRCSCHDK